MRAESAFAGAREKDDLGGEELEQSRGAPEPTGKAGEAERQPEFLVLNTVRLAFRGTQPPDCARYIPEILLTSMN